MTDDGTAPRPCVRLHLTNIIGLGATQLVQSLAPALEKVEGVSIGDIYLPDSGVLARYRRGSAGPPPKVYRRRLPNALSRLLECTVFAGRFDGDPPLLVLGDVPLRVRSRQIVFIHTPHMLPGSRAGSRLSALKYAVSRAIVRANLGRVSAFIVQTRVMRERLAVAYPAIADRIVVIPQPPPNWLLDAKLKRGGRRGDGPLHLFYPAADYPHKNHRLLEKADAAPGLGALVAELSVTIDPGRLALPTWVRALGRLDGDGMLRAYERTDALLFLSSAESYGLPLVEAMWIGLPIVCPDLPYARELCGDEAIYFADRDIGSLEDAIAALKSRLDRGWWPDWSHALQAAPRDWSDVARRMLAVASPDMVRAASESFSRRHRGSRPC